MMNKVEMQEYFTARSQEVEEYGDFTVAAQDVAEHLSLGCFCPHMFQMIRDLRNTNDSAATRANELKDDRALKWVQHVMLCHMSFLYSMAPIGIQDDMQQTARDNGWPPFPDVTSLGREIQ